MLVTRTIQALTAAAALVVAACGAAPKATTSLRAPAAADVPQAKTPAAPPETVRPEAPPAATAETEAAPEPEPPPPPELKERLAALSSHLKQKALGPAEEELRRVEALGVSGPKARFRVAYARATFELCRNRPDRAADALLAVLPEIEAAKNHWLAFTVHNTLIMIRTAEGDVPAALVESEEMTRAGRRAARPGNEEETLGVALKDLWHRAYLLRMLAETQPASRRLATVRYAEAARQAYGEVAPLPDYNDSVAVLEGFFAALDGDAPRALGAARRVRVDENRDLEDLYLALVAFDAGGDAAAADRLRARIREADVYVAQPITAAWAQRDVEARRNGKKARFSPVRPGARP